MFIKIKINLFILMAVISFFCLSGILFGAQSAYRVGARDILHISVWGEPDMDKDVIVSPNGSINYPLLGAVPVCGLTVKQIDEEITRLLEKDYLVNPQVDVMIKEYHSQKVLVLGEVENPGLYSLTGAASLLEVISQAGGMSEKAGNKISISRRTGEERKITSSSDDISALVSEIEPILIDLDELLKKGNLTNNIPVLPGDVIFLAARKDANILEQKVYISGKIEKAGAYDYQKGLTALNACIMAGGFLKSAAPSRAILTRNFEGNQQVIKLDLNKIKQGKIQDTQLQPGDRLYIPERFW